MYKIAFIDIDGTLLTSDHRILQDTAEAIHRVNSIKKIPVILVSARPPQAIGYIYSALQLDSYFGCFNGALIVKPNGTGFSTVQSLEIDTNLLSPIVNAVSSYDLNISFYNDEQWYAIRDDHWVEHEEHSTNTKAEIIDALSLLKRYRELKTSPHKILLMGDAPVINECEPALRKQFAGQLNIAPSKPVYLELVSIAASKKLAMNFLLDLFAISKEDAVAIGDNFNDIEMIQNAGMGVAMGNAPNEVKKHAQFVTLTNEENGVAVALNKFIV